MKSWLKDIERAMSKAEIVANARDYCALLHPRDLAPLPAECREIRIDDDEDIARLRAKLSKGVAGVYSDPSEIEKARDLLSYLDRASERLDELKTY